jgi:hypothetical protein
MEDINISYTICPFFEFQAMAFQQIPALLVRFITEEFIAVHVE